jgi:hypothetical protein
MEYPGWEGFKQELKENIGHVIAKGDSDEETLQIMLTMLDNTKIRIRREDSDG